MSRYQYDLFVIGGGSGGIRAARWSSSLGAKVALCEKDRLGGTCVIRGCIPKKLMFYASEFNKNFELAKAYGWEAKTPQLNWRKFNQTRDQEIRRLEKIYGGILKNNYVNFISGEGRLKDPHTVEVQGKTYTAKHILIAVGGKPSRLPIKGAELCISSDDIFSLKTQPRSLLVLGAGYIGLEFASIFNGLGTNVTVMFRKKQILSGFDMDLRKNLQEELLKKGIQMLAEKSPLQIEKKEGLFHVTDDKGGKWSGDLALMATGRKADTESLNLKALGIKTEGSKILVNEFFETNCPSVLAVGDCIRQDYQLTPVALNQGMFVSERLFSKPDKKTWSYESVPSAIFTQPPAGTVGLSEEQALEKGFSVQIYASSFRPLKLTLTDSEEKSYMKLVVCKKTDQVLGCHIISPNAEEILQGFAVAIKNKLKKTDWDKCLGIHPSSAEELVTMRTPRG